VRSQRKTEVRPDNRDTAPVVIEASTRAAEAASEAPSCDAARQLQVALALSEQAPRVLAEIAHSPLGRTASTPQATRGRT
jgi:hypothetical protein